MYLSLSLSVSVSLGAQHETKETASLIITYLSLCPPQGLHVTITDVLHWQVRNTHANSKTRRSGWWRVLVGGVIASSLTCVDVPAEAEPP